MNIKGKLIQVNETQQVTDSFKKRTFWVEYFEDNPQYTETLEFQLIQDKCEVINSYKVNDEVEVSFNLKGRKWANKEGKTSVFNTLQAWRIAKAEQQEQTTQSTVKEGDDLPF